MKQAAKVIEIAPPSKTYYLHHVFKKLFTYYLHICFNSAEDMGALRDATLYSAIESILGNKPGEIRKLLQEHPDLETAFAAIGALTSELQSNTAFNKAAQALEAFSTDVHILKKGAFDYPSNLDFWTLRPEFLFARGEKALLESRGVSVVGSRTASEEGLKRAYQFAKLLCENGYTVISGLALGIDTAAHTGALRAGGKTVAVIGTPIDRYYPKENEELQKLISKKGCVVSQFSPLRPTQRLNFPQRNELMSALSLATVIVEASETSGALTQAKYCLKQRKPLFIMRNQIERSDLKWPRQYLDKGAIPLNTFDDLLAHLNKNTGSPGGNRNDQLSFA